MTQRETKDLQNQVKNTMKEFRKEQDGRYVCDICFNFYSSWQYWIEIDEDVLNQQKKEKFANGGKFDRFIAIKKLHRSSDDHKKAL